MRKRVYVSGPLSTGDRLPNVERAIQATLALLQAGYAPSCPHLTHFADPNDEYGWENWLETDEAWVAVSDAVLRLPGKSAGADRETAIASERHIPVVERIEDIDAAIEASQPRRWR